jgi:hypothetical protein
MKRKNEEEEVNCSSNNKKQKTSKEMYVVTTTDEEYEKSSFFVLLTLENNENTRSESLERKEERLILSNAHKFNPSKWLPNRKCLWDGADQRSVLGNLEFKGDSEPVFRMVDLTFSQCNETVVINEGRLPTKGDSILAYSCYTERLNNKLMNESDLFKLEISGDIWNIPSLYKEISKKICASLPDNKAKVRKTYLEVKETSSAMDWYDYFKDVALMSEDMIKEKWQIMIEKGFCFDYPIQENSE